MKMTVTNKEQAYNVLVIGLAIQEIENVLSLFENEERLSRLYHENKGNCQKLIDEKVEKSLKYLQVFAKKTLSFKLPRIVINDFVIEKHKIFFTAVLKILKAI